MPRRRLDPDTPALVAVRGIAWLARLLDLHSGDLSLAHYRILEAVAAGDERASRVAARLSVGKPTVSASVDSLCQRGLLLRYPVIEDQRGIALRLTPEGWAVLRTAQDELLRFVEEIMANTPDPERATEALTWLEAALQQRSEARGVAGTRKAVAPGGR